MTNPDTGPGVGELNLRRVEHSGLTRGWQVCRGDEPITFLFDEHADAVRALEEFRALTKAKEETGR